jgi:hypothetical protein
MWLLQPAKGRTAITHLQRDLLRCIPDYSIAVVSVSTEPASRDAFVLWHASGTAKLSVIPQRATTGRPFEHAGVTRCVRWRARVVARAAHRSSAGCGVPLWVLPPRLASPTPVDHTPTHPQAAL